MRKSRFSDDQIIGILKKHRTGGRRTPRKHGISDGTFHPCADQAAEGA